MRCIISLWLSKKEPCWKPVLRFFFFYRILFLSTSFHPTFNIWFSGFLFSLCLSQGKPGEDDLLPTAGQERTLPQLWGWGLASAQWRRSVIRGQEGSTQGRALLYSALVSEKQLKDSLWVWCHAQVLITSDNKLGIIWYYAVSSIKFGMKYFALIATLLRVSFIFENNVKWWNM